MQYNKQANSNALLNSWKSKLFGTSKEIVGGKKTMVDSWKWVPFQYIISGTREIIFSRSWNSINKNPWISMILAHFQTRKVSVNSVA